MRNKNQTGFTLIELLVVIAIIGLLASVVLLALNSARAKSRDAKRLADVRQLASAMELYFNDNSSYPTSNTSVGVYTLFAPTAAPNLSPKYIGQIPQAPNPPDNDSGTECDSSNNPYNYTTNTTGSTYSLRFCLGAATGGYSAGVLYLTPAGIAP